MRKRILTGITTTGTPHIGNYLGAIRPALELVAPDNESYFFLADYHSIIKNQNSDVDNFFDNVMINDSDEKIKSNRLCFLKNLKKFYSQIADFSFVAKN